MKDADNTAHATRNVSSESPVNYPQLRIATPIRGIESTPGELRHTLLRRDRLVQAIMRPFQAPVTIVCAGAGYGKTALVLDWAAQSPKHIAWLSLSLAENAIARFMASLRSVLHALSASMPDSPSASPAYGHSLDDMLAAVATLDRDLCLVLDNCHLLTDNDCLTLLDVLIANLPANLCLILLTRQQLPLRLARLRSMDRVRELDTRDLRFTSGEIMTALQHETFADIPPDELQRIALASEGWITGAHIRLQQVRDVLQHHSPLSHRNLLDEYVQQEILSPLPAGIRQFVLRTAGLPFISAGIAEAVGASLPDAPGMDELCTRLAFIDRDPSGNDRYRYNPLFAESAQRIATGALTDSDRESWRHDAANWLAANGELIQAAELAVDSADAAWKTSIITALCRHLADRSDLESLGLWLGRLPAATISSDPDLVYWSVMCKAGLGFTFGLDLPLLAAMAAEPDADGLATGRHALCAGLLAYHEGKTRDATCWLQSALDWLPSDAHVERMQAGTFLGKSAFRDGADAAAAKTTSRAAFHARSLPIDEQWCWRVIAADRGNAYALRGDIPSAISKYRLILAELPAILAHLEGFFHCRLVSLFIEQDDLFQARASFEAAQRLPARPPAEWRHDRVIAHMRLLLAEDRRDEAEEIGSQYVKSLRRHPRKTQLLLLLARIWLERGEMAMVESWLDDINLSDYPWVELFGDINHKVLAIDLDLVRGNVIHAAATSEALASEASATRRWSEFIHVSMRWAVALHELGEFTRSEDVAREALARAADGGFVHALLVPGFDTTAMFTEVWNERRDFRRLKHALRNVRNAPPHPLAHALTKRELEVVHLLAQGKSNNQIASETFISVNTVRNHLAKIFSKLEVISRSEAVARARQLDILD